MRILAVVDPWWGSCGYGFARAFRRSGHAVRVVPPADWMPVGWNGGTLRAARRILRPWLVSALGRRILDICREWSPDLLFVYKGTWVHPDVVRGAREAGTVAVNVYPDVSFVVHGPYIPRALPEYDWVFTTKTFGLEDMRKALGVSRASLLAHSFDPEVHRPVRLGARDLEEYGCDVSFAGTWSPKKQAFIEEMAAGLGGATFRVWGDGWNHRPVRGPVTVAGRGVHGDEYARVLCAARINLGLLSEARRGASGGDQVTTRSFEIPACGGFLLHERTEEFAELFREDEECAMFSTVAEAVGKARWFLDHEADRVRVADAGRRRALGSGYSVDAKAAEVVRHVRELAKAGAS